METMMSNLMRLLGVFALVLLNGFFVAAELALVKIRDTQIETMVIGGNRRAKTVRLLLRNLEATISATQFGITLASLGLGMLVEPVFEALLAPVFDGFHVESAAVRHTVAILTGFFINSFLLIVVGELGPKAIAIRKTVPVALWTAQPLAWFARITFPFVWLLNKSAMWLLKQAGIESVTEAEHAHSVEELRLLITASQRHSGATRLGRDIVLNALDLRRRKVREVMRPRQEIVMLDTDASITECLEVAEKSRYSRLPLCERGNLDKTLGVVHFKDLFAARYKAHSGADLAGIARKLIYVPETARLERLLQLFLERQLHFAIVVDEYGGTVGMVTLENILEELVGQIQDEFDQEKPLLVRMGLTSWEMAGGLPLHELSELVAQPLEEEGITTVSGWVTHRQGGFPKVGDTLTLGAFELRVEEMDSMRVAKLRLTRKVTEETEGKSGNA
ncbi:MAG TPA: hemolysin family protein [Verrucomicrobiae bacterium]|jgi:CBS domain containing-hemolysin-like protein|nr:hemolysin family protein [Verrucomicrobiae bacterium]